MFQQLGGTATASLQQHYAQSPHWKDGQFQNLLPTGIHIGLKDVPGLLYKQLFDKAGRVPERPLPVQPLDTAALLAAGGAPRFAWYGHSAVLMRLQGQTMLIDPMLGPDAAPIAPFASKRFSEGTLALIEDFPPIDLMLITHDHYDHLDLASLRKLMPKTQRYLVALGVGRHLIEWGVPPEDIIECDWWDQHEVGGLNITFTPSRHFSGRGLTDRAKSLWGGWAIQGQQASIYWSGDGGYGDHFCEVGERLGPFDLGFMECGQYNELWHQIHLFPEEAVQAALDAGVAKALPVHWAGFTLALHHWKDPIERFVKAAEQEGLSMLNPRLGEVVRVEQEGGDPWWEEVA